MDDLATLIVERGLAASTYLLDLNRSLSVPHDFPLSLPWNLPSRLFRFPIEVSAGHDETSRRVGLMHPLLADHPFVRHVEEMLGIALDPGGAPNVYGVSNALTGLWWHAVDLVSAGQWRALLETRCFTTDEDMARAGLSHAERSPCDHGGARCARACRAVRIAAVLKAIAVPARQWSRTLADQPSRTPRQRRDVGADSRH